MNVAIIKYNAGNIFSVETAFDRLGVNTLVTDDPQLIAQADRVVFPGQGKADTAMDYLRRHVLDRLIADLKQPVLGICIGQQLLCRHSEEGDTDCIGIIPADVRRFIAKDPHDKVPAMGWNEITDLKSDLFKGIGEGEFVYFVHSYYAPLCGNTIATANYILPYSAAMQKDNFYTLQFHPEKSGPVGEKILRNFIELKI